MKGAKLKVRAGHPTPTPVNDHELIRTTKIVNGWNFVQPEKERKGNLENNESELGKSETRIRKRPGSSA